MNKRLADRVGMVKKFTRKPIILTETASHYEGGDKASWIRNGYMAAFRKYPKVKGILYLDTDEPHRQLGHPDWRLVKPDDGSALAAYRDIISKWKFKGRLK